jgi:predicted nucleic acid-binding protein
VTGVILDTDVFSYLQGRRPQARRYAPLLVDVAVAIAFPTVAELHFGARKGRWGAAQTRRLEEDIRRLAVLPVDDDLPRLCGRLRADAAGIGHPLGQPRHANDLWIAACAVHYGLPLLTGNTRHFAGLPGLELLAD